MTEPIPAPPAEVSNDARMWGMLCHLGALATFVVPVGNVLGPLVFWLLKKNEYPFVDDQGKEALNFQITMLICGAISFVLCFVLIGIPLLIAVGVLAIVFAIIGAVTANRGETYRYPFSFKFIR